MRFLGDQSGKTQVAHRGKSARLNQVVFAQSGQRKHGPRKIIGAVVGEKKMRAKSEPTPVKKREQPMVKHIQKRGKGPLGLCIVQDILGVKPR